MTAEMSLERFRQLLETHGAAPSRWPAAEGRAASDLRDRSAEARALLAAAAALDSVLDQGPEQRPSAALRGAVLAARPKPAAAPGWWRLVFGPLPSWQPLAVLALAAILGFGLGTSGTLLPPEDEIVVVDIAAIGFATDTLEAEESN